MKLVDAIPELAEELRKLLRGAGRPDLAEQCRTIEIVSPCGCGDRFCSGFYTGPKPDGAWGPCHENIVLEPTEGDLILDVVDGVVRFVEILDRPELRDRVASVFTDRT